MRELELKVQGGVAYTWGGGGPGHNCGILQYYRSVPGKCPHLNIHVPRDFGPHGHLPGT